MSLRGRKNLPVGSSIFSWAGAPAILDDTASPSRIDALSARRGALRRAFEDQLLGHCLSSPLDKSKVGSDKSHVVRRHRSNLLKAHPVAAKHNDVRETFLDAGRRRERQLLTHWGRKVSAAHAQQLPSIESVKQSYVACVQSAFVGRLDDFAVNGNLAQVAERALLDGQIEENALYTTAISSGIGHAQAIALSRAAVEQLKASLKAKMLAPPTAMPPKK
jgi:hypothetical protein